LSHAKLSPGNGRCPKRMCRGYVRRREDYSELIRESGIRLQPDAAGYDIGPGLSG